MSPFLKTGIVIACLSLNGKMEVVIELSKPERRKSEKTSALSLIILVGMSVSWLTFVESKLKIHFKISSLSTYENEKREHCFLLHTSPILSTHYADEKLNWNMTNAFLENKSINYS